VFERHGVQVVFGAHDHDYERLVPWREGGDITTQAVLNIVSGGGGAALYGVGRSQWTATSRSAHHYVKGHVAGCVAQFQAIDRTGAVFDTYTFDRCAQADDVAAPDVTLTEPAAGASVSGPVLVRAAASDDTRIEKVDLWVDGVLRAIDLTAPYQFTWDASAVGAGPHTIEVRAYDLDGRRDTDSHSVTVEPPAPGEGDIVIRATDVPTSAIVGDWARTADTTAAGGLKLRNPNRGAAKPAASTPPVSYFDVTFDAAAGTPYHLWLRMRADSNSYTNDSVYVWVNGAATPLSVILEEGSGAGVSGWGWNDSSYGGLGPHITFASGGVQRLRIGVREDGVSIDQIVLSRGTYLTTRPGATKNDATLVPR
jgi:hypothetical protein